MMDTLKVSLALLAACLIALSNPVAAQSKIPPQSGSAANPPGDRGMVKNPDASPQGAPSDSGIITKPPKVDQEAVQAPPTNGEAKIKDATEDIDRRNRKKTEDKIKPRKGPGKPDAAQ
jgi:hypothetical protein